MKILNISLILFIVHVLVTSFFLCAEDRLKSLVVAYSDQEFSIDPLHAYTTTEAQLFTAIYEGLVAYDPVTVDPVAGQAERWEVSRDGKVYTFFIRENANFSNGDPLQAIDFQNSWLRMIDPDEQAEYSFLFDVIKGAAAYRKGKITDLSKVGIRAISKKIFEVELEEPAEHFIRLLAHHSFTAIHPSYLKLAKWDIQSRLIGNGPFKVSAWSNGKLILDKNDYYWGVNDINLDSIEVYFSDNKGDITRNFLKGEIHWANIWVQSENLGQHIVANRLFATTYFYFRTNNEPFNDKRVRIGLSLLLPWQRIRDSETLYFPSETLVPELPQYPRIIGINEADVNQAFQLLKRAGFEKGLGLPSIEIIVIAGSSAERVAVLMEEAWEENLQVEVSVKALDYNSYMAEVKGGNFTLGHQTWVGDFADPLTFLQMWVGSSNLNEAIFQDSRYDRAVNKAIYLENSKRMEILARAESILIKEAVILPINNQVALNLVNKAAIMGWHPNLLDIHPFRFLGIKGSSEPVEIAPKGVASKEFNFNNLSFLH